MELDSDPTFPGNWKFSDVVTCDVTLTEWGTPFRLMSSMIAFDECVS